MFINTENSKTSEPHKFVFNLSQKLDLRSSNNMLLFIIYIFITHEYI